MNPNDLLRLARLLTLQGEAMRLFSDTNRGGNGEVSRITALSLQVDAIATEVAELAKELGAVEDLDDSPPADG